MTKFMVLYYSQNWLTDGLIPMSYDSLEEAEKYVREIKEKGLSNKAEHIKIVQVVSEFDMTLIDHELYGFTLNKK